MGPESAEFEGVADDPFHMRNGFEGIGPCPGEGGQEGQGTGEQPPAGPASILQQEDHRGRNCERGCLGGVRLDHEDHTGEKCPYSMPDHEEDTHNHSG